MGFAAGLFLHVFNKDVTVWHFCTQYLHGPNKRFAVVSLNKIHIMQDVKLFKGHRQHFSQKTWNIASLPTPTPLEKKNIICYRKYVVWEPQIRFLKKIHEVMLKS